MHSSLIVVLLEQLQVKSMKSMDLMLSVSFVGRSLCNNSRKLRNLCQDIDTLNHLILNLFLSFIKVTWIALCCQTSENLMQKQVCQLFFLLGIYCLLFGRLSSSNSLSMHLTLSLLVLFFFFVSISSRNSSIVGNLVVKLALRRASA